MAGATGRTWNQWQRSPRASRRDPEGVQRLVRLARNAGYVRQLHVSVDFELAKLMATLGRRDCRAVISQIDVEKSVAVILRS